MGTLLANGLFTCGISFLSLLFFNKEYYNSWKAIKSIIVNIYLYGVIKLILKKDE